MPWITQMIGFGLMLIGIAIALWVSFWLLLIIFAVAIGFVVWSHLRAFLLAKGILNPTPGIPPEPSDTTIPVTVVEGEFERVEETKPRID